MHLLLLSIYSAHNTYLRPFFNSLGYKCTCTSLNFSIKSSRTHLPILAIPSLSPSYGMYFPTSHKLSGGLLSPQSQYCLPSRKKGCCRAKSVHHRALVLSCCSFYSCHTTSVFPLCVSIHHTKAPLWFQIHTQTRAMQDDSFLAPLTGPDLVLKAQPSGADKEDGPSCLTHSHTQPASPALHIHVEPGIPILTFLS